MNNQIKLAVAAALLAAASSANAGISIPAGDWTLDIGGVVNAYYTSSKTTGATSASNIGTGLLPNVLSFSGKTRQNDLDVGFTIAIQPGGYTNKSLIQGGAATQENRQAFLTFGDASWGSVLLGKNIGIFAQDAILNDMTLLGVGNGAKGAAGAITTTTLGGIGAGYIYADWKEQIAYTTPNFGGFQATAALTQGWNAQSSTVGGVVGANQTGAHSSSQGGSEPAFEAKASYDFSADAFKGKVWVSGFTQKIVGVTGGAVALTAAGTAYADSRATAGDIGANISVAGFGVTGYYYTGKGMGTTGALLDGLTLTGQKRDSDGGYIQVTYVLPTATKLGFAVAESSVDSGTGDTATFTGTKNERFTVGAYHPLTKHLNLVAEYNSNKATALNASATTNTVSLGGILFF